jgi:glycosidase
LNLRCPQVREEMKKVIKFWLQDKNVDGFRLDAAKHLFENESLKDEPKKQKIELKEEEANVLNFNVF